ncbi:MAG: hypothetical protein REI11_14730, partial [Patulibacter sp.]|nr:hypothetical protein [Patulibacter sp.]
LLSIADSVPSDPDVPLSDALLAHWRFDVGAVPPLSKTIADGLDVAAARYDRGRGAGSAFRAGRRSLEKLKTTDWEMPKSSDPHGKVGEIGCEPLGEQPMTQRGSHTDKNGFDPTTAHPVHEALAQLLGDLARRNANDRARREARGNRTPRRRGAR